MISIRIDYDSHYQKNQCTITYHETIIFEIVANTALGSPDTIFCRLNMIVSLDIILPAVIVSPVRGS